MYLNKFQNDCPVLRSHTLRSFNRFCVIKFSAFSDIRRKKSLTVIFGKVFSIHVKSLKIWIGEKEYVGTRVTFFKEKNIIVTFCTFPNWQKFWVFPYEPLRQAIECVFFAILKFLLWFEENQVIFLFYWRWTDSSGSKTIL